MACHPEPVRPKEPDLTPRQRWIAAQRLAAGDTLRMAAVMANTNSAVLSLLLNEDPEFQGLIEDCRVIHAMPRDEWRARAEAYARDAAERAMVDGRVSTLNLCLKATGILANAPDDAEDDPDAWMDGLTDEELADYEALDDEAEYAEAAHVPAADLVPERVASASADACRALAKAAAPPPSTSPMLKPVITAAGISPPCVPSDGLAVAPGAGRHEPVSLGMPPAAAGAIACSSAFRDTTSAAPVTTGLGLDAPFLRSRPPPHRAKAPGGLSPPATAGPLMIA